jgi:hypothetical protein
VEFAECEWVKKEKRIERRASSYLYLFGGVIQTCGLMDVVGLGPPRADDGRRRLRKLDINRYRAEQSMRLKYVKGGVHHRKEPSKTTFSANESVVLPSLVARIVQHRPCGE